MCLIQTNVLAEVRGGSGGLSIQAAMTKSHRLGDFKHRYISHSHGGWKSKFKAPVEAVPGESYLPGSQTVLFLLCPHRAGELREFSGVSLIRAQIPFMTAPPS